MGDKTWKKSVTTCLCCGKEFLAYNCHLKRGNGKYCSLECKCKSTPYDDLFGNRFGKLTVVSKNPTHYRNHVVWDCECDCGRSVSVRSDALKSGKTKSCGCYHDSVAWITQLDRIFAIEKGMYLQSIVKRSKERGWESPISFERFRSLIHKPCHYCGMEGQNSHKDRLRSGKLISGLVVKYNGIDRVDNTKGYTNENTVTCCRRCNVAKSTMTQYEFELWIENVYRNIFDKFSQRAAVHG